MTCINTSPTFTQNKDNGSLICPTLSTQTPACVMSLQYHVNLPVHVPRLTMESTPSPAASIPSESKINLVERGEKQPIIKAQDYELLQAVKAVVRS